MNKRLDCAGKLLDLSLPQVMGILNTTPDSFSDGGVFFARDAAIDRAWQMFREGAAIIDVGGESTRPGAQPVSLQEELDRVIPVIEALHAELPVVISIDTSKPEVMREAVRAGAGMINDVYALRQEGAMAVAADCNVPVCLMHMKGEPRTMQKRPSYDDVVEEVKSFLLSRVEVCLEAGIRREQLLVDPGFGFGKTLQHNLQLLNRLPDIAALELPVLVGISRKSMLSVLLDERPVEGRLYGGIAAATVALWQGASIVRVHDVAPTVDALKITAAVKQIN
ncbi:MAG TPA: dihydropteroate synthase [Gammaproteobacteria bacterium]|nr:dihydropteroate synthase [Gammaproteobacteria bacterium]